MTTIHRHGLTRLSDGEEGDTHFRFNVVFIHGLRGHPRATWEAKPAPSSEPSNNVTKEKGVRSWFQRQNKSISTTTEESGNTPSQSPNIFWPEQYLASDIPQTRVWTYGYNADVIGGLFQANNKNSVSQHGRDLAVRLERELEDDKPIVFIVHSLGGIVLKSAIYRSEKICERTKLIIFLGTPHRGSGYAGWGQIASNLARLALQDSNKKILQTLEVNSEVLDNIHEEFKTIMSKRRIKVHSFQEGQGISGMKGMDEKVVDDFSSKLDLPRELETVEGIDANHMQMARYSSREDEGYRAIRGVLKGTIQHDLESHNPPVAAADVPSM